MFRLDKIFIKGFKDPNREIHYEFSPDNITIVYGENGSGKTTFLKVLQAILKQDKEFLLNENVQLIELYFSKNGKKIKLELNPSTPKFIVKNYDTSYQDAERYLASARTILLDIYRGLTTSLTNIDTNLIAYINQELKTIKSSQRFLYDSFQKIQNLINLTNEQKVTLNFEDAHLQLNNLQISEIGKWIIADYVLGQKKLNENLQIAYSQTIDKALDFNEGNDYPLPENFQERLIKQKGILSLFVKELSTSNLKTKLEEFLGNENLVLNGNNLFKALIHNLLIKAEENEVENLSLKATRLLIDKFNRMVSRDKKLILNEQEIFIQLPNENRHELTDLSSGERQLLSFLFTYLIAGRGRDIFFIDEPEISMSLYWQEDLLNILKEINPHSQIIVATHSPTIADGKTKNLIKLK